MHGLGAGLRHGGIFALLLHHLFHLTAESVHPGLQVRLLGSRQAFNGGVHPLEEPRVAQRSTGDHDAVAAGALHHLHGVFRRVDVAVAQHRHLHRRLDLGDDVQVDARGVHLLPGAGVDGDEFSPRLLAGFGALHRRDVVGVPAFPHLDRHRAGGVGLDLLDDAAAEVGVQHQLAARAARDDLRGRAAHVDVQKVELVFFNGRCGLAHDLGHLAEDLHAVGCAVGFGFEQADCFVVVVDQRSAGHHLADRKACAVLGHQPAAGRVRKARHRAKNCPVGQGDISDFQRIHLIPRFA